MATKAAATHTMQSDAYQEHSFHQYDAHHGWQHLLEGILERLATRISTDEQQRRHIADLGAADGANSMRTLQWAISTLENQLQQKQACLPPLDLTFEEHPHSDAQMLQSTIDRHQDWFQARGIHTRMQMQSFYEPLFPPESVDLLLSYMCLHWLDSGDTKHSFPEWKSWATAVSDATEEQRGTLTQFVFLNEFTAPPAAQARWRQDLAHRHLAQFLAWRARELRPGAEMLLMMVGTPNQYVTPPSSSKAG